MGKVATLEMVAKMGRIDVIMLISEIEKEIRKKSGEKTQCSGENRKEILKGKV